MSLRDNQIIIFFLKSIIKFKNYSLVSSIMLIVPHDYQISQL